MKQLITMRVVEKFVEKRPDGKNIKGPNGIYTYFNRVADQNGDFENPDEVRPGCLFGHIIASLGGDAWLVVEGMGIDSQDDVLSKKLTEKDRRVLKIAQSRADGGELWAKALEYAKNVVRVDA